MGDIGQDIYQQFGNMSYTGSMYKSLAQQANFAEQELMDNISKALTTGDGVVTSGSKSAGDGSPLRTQFLWGTLEKVSAAQEDFAFVKRIKKHKVYSNTFEWSAINQYGGAGDNFIAENSSTGLGVDYTSLAADDVFSRLVQQIRYMYAVRQVGVVANAVKSIQDPAKVAEEAMRTELLGKMNIAMYWGDSLKQSLQFDGLEAQIMKWVGSTTLGGWGFTNDAPILFDCQGRPISQELLNEACMVSSSLFGAPQTLLMSTMARQDTMKLLYPYQRTGMGDGGNTFGVRPHTFASDFGDINLVADKTLRPNRPLMFDGNGSSGLPRTSATVDASLTADVSAGITVSGSGVTYLGVTTAGTGNFWEFSCKRGYAASALAKPAVPSNSASFGNQTNNLAPGTYYYAVSVVVNGKESLPLYLKAGANAGTADSTIGNATAVTITSSNALAVLTLTNAGITGADASKAKYRIYRTASLSSAPTSISQFGLLAECGQSNSATTVFYDNGFYIPGTDTAFLLTESKYGNDGIMLAQLLPIMLRSLPNAILADPIAILAFIAPIVFVPRHHVILRNVGRVS